MTATLLVSGSAPPIPSIWRTSGEPIAASRTRSRNSALAGRSLARKKGPFDVPPRISVQGIRVCDDAIRLPLSQIFKAQLRDLLAHVVNIESEFSTCKPFAGHILFANPLLPRCSDLLHPRALHNHNSIVIGDYDVTSLDQCTRAHDGHIHRSE